MLSIIVPVFNTINTIDRCLNSILKQGINDLEIILVDDGSDYVTRIKCDEWAEREATIKVIHKVNGGLSDARNAGVKMAKGEYVTFVDSDDFVQDNSYMELMELIKEHPEYDIVEFPVFVHFGTKTEYVLKFCNQTFCSFEEYWIKGKGYKHSYAWNKIYRRELFTNVAFPVGVLFEDLHTIPNLMRNARCLATSNKGIYYYCYNDKGITATADGKALTMMLDAYMKVVAETPRLIDDNDFYMELVNRQLDVYLATGRKPIIPSRHIYNIRSIDNKSYRWKARIINLCGIHNLCRLVKLKARIIK